jgi:hypothetical protein
LLTLAYNLVKMFNRLSGYRNLWEAIIRPLRQEYTPDMLGPVSFLLGEKGFTRRDIRLVNSRGLQIEVSIFEPDDLFGTDNPLVIYSHGNCGSRLEALAIAPSLLLKGIALL